MILERSIDEENINFFIPLFSMKECLKDNKLEWLLNNDEKEKVNNKEPKEYQEDINTKSFLEIKK